MVKERGKACKQSPPIGGGGGTEDASGLREIKVNETKANQRQVCGNNEQQQKKVPNAKHTLPTDCTFA